MPPTCKVSSDKKNHRAKILLQGNLFTIYIFLMTWNFSEKSQYAKMERWISSISVFDKSINRELFFHRIVRWPHLTSYIEVNWNMKNVIKIKILIKEIANQYYMQLITILKGDFETQHWGEPTFRYAYFYRK